MTLLLLYGSGGLVDGYSPPVSTYGYTQPKDVIVRVQALDGTWETCGADRARGVVPENVQLTSDQWGSKTASFQLRRDPKAVWPDIGAFAPVEVEVGGRLVWSGRVNETPVRDSTDSVITVQCVGWQAHLDDDLYERVYVHTNLTEYKDARSALNATLGRVGTAAGMVQTEAGVLAVGWPKGAQLNGSSGCYVGATLDLGPQSTAKRVVFTYEKASATASAGVMSFICRASDNSDFANTSTSQDISSTDIASLASSGTVAATVTTARRFVHFALSFTSASNTTLGEDNTIKITSAQVFADTAYESSNASVLKSDAVINDALSRATVLYDADRSGIETGTFNIPEFAPSEPRTPREIWNAVDAFEDRYKKIDVLRRPLYKAKPTTPEVEVGAWSGMEFEDSSSNSGEDIYSRVIITGSQPNGLPLRVFRTQAQQEGSASSKVQTISGNSGEIGIFAGDTPTFDNNSFATNTSSWSKVNSTITRDTGTFDSSPASGRWDSTGASDALPAGSSLSTTLTGTFAVGKTYRAVFAVRPGTFTGSGPASFSVLFGNATDYGKSNLYITGASASFSFVSIDWTPQSTITGGVTLTLISNGSTINGSATTYLWIDSAGVQIANTTLVERRGFLRTKQVATNFMLTEGAAQQIADKWLLSHRASPFKGRAKLVGNAAIRDVRSGRAVPVEEMLLRTGELVRFGDRVDPDNGAVGRDGRVVEVQYDADNDAIDMTIDNSRAGFEALLERLGVVLGQNRSL